MELTDIERALDFIEENLTERLNMAEIARHAYCSEYHFQRLFGLVCGMNPGEYLRRRRLSRAALDLLHGEKVLNVALKYGYGTSESFSRAFFKFHGIKPMQAKRGAAVKNFPRFDFNRTEKGENMTFEIRELPAKELMGFKTHFFGTPSDEERARQEHALWERTRGKQWLLFGAGGGKEEEYAIVTNITEEGYDYCIAYELDSQTQNVLFDPAISGMDVRGFGFEPVKLESCRAAVFATEKGVHPIADYQALRRLVLSDALKDVEFRDAPERVVYHWHLQNRKERQIEICLPII